MLPKFIFKDIQKEEQSTQTRVIQPTLKVRIPSKHREGVQLTPGTQHVLLPSFTMLILGKPGSGKSHLINELIDQQQFYKKKFDRIIYVGPTRYPSCIQDQFNTCNNLEVKFIDKKIAECQGWAQNMLIVFDDVISQIPNTQKTRLQQIFYNRRHQLNRGTISIILTSQKLTSVPTWIRSTVNCVASFSIAKSQIKNLFNQIPLLSNPIQIKKQFQSIEKHKFVFLNLQLGKAFNSDFIQI